MSEEIKPAASSSQTSVYIEDIETAHCCDAYKITMLVSALIVAIGPVLHFQVHANVVTWASISGAGLLLFAFTCVLKTRHYLRQKVDEKLNLNSVQKIAAHGYQWEVENIIEKKIDVNVVDGVNHLTLLHVAAMTGNTDALATLLTHGADVKKASEVTLLTPLHVAALHNQEKCFDNLLAKGAKLDEKDIEGKTPLHLAAEKGFINIVKIILSHQLKNDLINIQDKKGNTPVHLAAKNNHPSVVSALLKNGANYEEKNKDGQTCLHLAAQNSDASVTKTIVEVVRTKTNNALPFINEGDTNKRTALSYASGENRTYLKSLGVIATNILNHS